jgi:predicted nucleotidyltransferase component of viral defense system
MKNIIASIQAKLRQLAQVDGKNYQLILIRYFQERLIYRISVSEYCENFCLKGGTLLYALEQEKSRPTLDIDLLSLKILPNQSHLKNVFAEICQDNDHQDGVTFNLDSLITSEISKDAKYSGVRVKIEAYLGSIRQILQIDIGFGDIVTPRPIFMVYPTLLDMNMPHIWAYSIETVIAEKFEAMIDLAETNSRMKDFYDVFHLLKSPNLDIDILKEAIIQTFQRRQTSYQNLHPLFNIEFAIDAKRIIQWSAFLRKSKLNETIDFQEVMKSIKEHLLSIYKEV